MTRLGRSVVPNEACTHKQTLPSTADDALLLPRSDIGGGCRCVRKGPTVDIRNEKAAAEQLALGNAQRASDDRRQAAKLVALICAVTCGYRAPHRVLPATSTRFVVRACSAALGARDYSAHAAHNDGAARRIKQWRACLLVGKPRLNELRRRWTSTVAPAAKEN